MNRVKRVFRDGTLRGMFAMRLFSKSLLATTAALLSSGVAFAADLAPAPDAGWSLSITPFYLYRMKDDGLLFLDGAPSTANAPIAFADDLDSNGTFGAGVTLSGDVGGYGLDVRGLWSLPETSNWSDTVTPVTTPGFLGVSLGGADSGGFGVFSNALTDVDLTAERQTTFSSLEANLGSSHQQSLRWTVGPRMFWIGDELNVDVDPAPSGFAGLNTGANIDITNKMLGGQAGLQWMSPASDSVPVDLRLAVNGGVVHDWADLDLAVVGLGSPYPAVSESDSKWGGFGELGVEANWHVSDGVRFGVGYNLLYLSSVANSVSSLNASELGLSTARLKYDSAIYHSGTVSLTFDF